MTILIVDDEALIHASIDYCLKQLSVPELTVIHAANGNEMLSCMLQNRVDAALVDIRMGASSGLDAIGEASSRWPDTLYYVMTSFSEFEYARTALQLGVEDYLLKPIDIATLGKVVERIRTRLAENREKIRENFRGWLSAAESSQEISYLYPGDYFAAAALLTYDARESRQKRWVPEFLEAQEDMVVSFLGREGLLLLFYAKDSSKVNRLVAKFPHKGYPAGVTAFLTGTCRNSGKLFQQLRGLFSLAEGRVLTGIHRRYDGAEKPSREELQACKLWLRLWDDMYQQNTAGYFNQLQRLSGFYRNRDQQPVSPQLGEFVGAIVNDGTDFRGMPLRDVLQRLSQAVNPVVYAQQSPEKLDAVLAYVNDHYAANISLEEIAQKFQLTPNYLSTLFKKKFGIKFTDYLTGLRINRAKQLLAGTKLSVRDISEQVGYFSQSHFNKQFQKMENCSPLEYRSRNKS